MSEPDVRGNELFQLILNLSTAVAVLQTDVKRVVKDVSELQIAIRAIEIMAGKGFDENEQDILHQLITNAGRERIKEIEYKFPLRIALISAAFVVFLSFISAILVHFLG